MSAKLLYNVADEHKVLHKDIGCMNGIFQLFDRRHFLSGRRVNGQKQKRIPSGQIGKRMPNSTLPGETENNLKDKQRISTESSRTSFSSSSCSSGFSSFDCHKIPQKEPSSYGRSVFPETPSRHFPITQANSSVKLLQSVDIHDVAKDCIYREFHGLPIKTTIKDEGHSHMFKHVDSPRPMQVSKNSGSSESFPVAKLREGRLNQGADCSRLVVSKDSPRFSCDGREITRKSTAKVKELPRLSLDSKQSTTRSSNCDKKSNYILENLQRGNENFNKSRSSLQELDCYKGPSHVVVKLMGLEMSRDYMSTKENQRRPIKTLTEENFDISSRSAKITEENKQNHIPWSPRTSQSEPISPWFRNTDPAMRSPSTKLSSVTTPVRRQPDDRQSFQVPDFKCRESSTAKGLNSSSVYGEIDKMLPELEFKKSGKDLRALKQILEAMQKTKEMQETRKSQDSNFISQISNNRSNHDQSSTRNLHSSTPVLNKDTSSPKHSKSPIVIMKLPTVVEKSSDPASLVFPTDTASGLRRLRTSTSTDCKKESVYKQTEKDITPRMRDPSSNPLQTTNKNSRATALRSRQISKVPQHVARKNPIRTNISSDTVSPRLQQKIGLENKSRPTTPTSDLSRARRQLNRQTSESDSLGRISRPKSPNSLHNNHLYKVKNGVKDWRDHGDANSPPPDRRISLAAHTDRGINITNTSKETNDTSFPKEFHKQKSPAEILNDYTKTTQPAIVTLEQPSPVSVLDATFYRDESPSPVKKISSASKDDWTPISEGVECNLVDLNYSYSSISNLSYTNSENTEGMVQTLGNDIANIHYISPLTENINSDDRYVYEILLASCLLRALDSGATTIQFHKSGLPINPSMLFVLEEIKGRTKVANDEHTRIHRKLIFDAVNEILVQKSVLECPSTQRLSSNKQTGRESKSEQLWREICLKINELQANSYCRLADEDDRTQSLLGKELMQQSVNWTDSKREISGLVLDVERLIFKDLISEIVSSEMASLQLPVSTYRRKLVLLPS